MPTISIASPLASAPNQKRRPMGFPPAYAAAKRWFTTATFGAVAPSRSSMPRPSSRRISIVSTPHLQRIQNVPRHNADFRAFVRRRRPRLDADVAGAMARREQRMARQRRGSHVRNRLDPFEHAGVERGNLVLAVTVQLRLDA